MKLRHRPADEPVDLVQPVAEDRDADGDGKERERDRAQDPADGRESRRPDALDSATTGQAMARAWRLAAT